MIDFPSSFSVSQTIREAMRKTLKIVAIRSTTFPPSPDGHVVSERGTALSAGVFLVADPTLIRLA